MQEAVKIYRELARQNPEKHEPNLAVSLIKLSLRLKNRHYLLYVKLCFFEKIVTIVPGRHRYTLRSLREI